MGEGKYRQIEKGFAKNRKLVDLERAAGIAPRGLRLGFVNLLHQCDRNGVFEWLPRALAGECMRFDDDVDFGAVLGALERAGIVARFELAGNPWGVVREFLRYQRPGNEFSVDGYPLPPLELLPEDLRGLVKFRPNPKAKQKPPIDATTTPPKTHELSRRSGPNSGRFGGTDLLDRSDLEDLDLDPLPRSPHTRAHGAPDDEEEDRAPVGEDLDSGELTPDRLVALFARTFGRPPGPQWLDGCGRVYLRQYPAEFLRQVLGACAAASATVLRPEQYLQGALAREWPKYQRAAAERQVGRRGRSPATPTSPAPAAAVDDVSPLEAARRELQGWREQLPRLEAELREGKPEVRLLRTGQVQDVRVEIERLEREIERLEREQGGDDGLHEVLA